MENGWKQPLTWDALCEACLIEIGIQPARQTLMRHYRVEMAYSGFRRA